MRYIYTDLCLLNECSSKHHRNSLKRFVRLSNSRGSVVTVGVHDKHGSFTVRADMKLSHSKRLGTLKVNLIPPTDVGSIREVFDVIYSLKEELNESLGTDFRLKGEQDGKSKKN